LCWCPSACWIAAVFTLQIAVYQGTVGDSPWVTVEIQQLANALAPDASPFQSFLAVYRAVDLHSSHLPQQATNRDQGLLIAERILEVPHCTPALRHLLVSSHALDELNRFLVFALELEHLENQCLRIRCHFDYLLR